MFKSWSLKCDNCCCHVADKIIVTEAPVSRVMFSGNLLMNNSIIIQLLGWSLTAFTVHIPHRSLISEPTWAGVVWSVSSYIVGAHCFVVLVALGWATFILSWKCTVNLSNVSLLATTITFLCYKVTFLWWTFFASKSATSHFSDCKLSCRYRSTGCTEFTLTA